MLIPRRLLPRTLFAGLVVLSTATLSWAGYFDNIPPQTTVCFDPISPTQHFEAWGQAAVSARFAVEHRAAPDQPWSPLYKADAPAFHAAFDQSNGGFPGQFRICVENRGTRAETINTWYTQVR